VALARAFAMRPQLLLADEPTGNLDAATGEQVIDLMFDMNAEAGTTLILVTHDEALASLRCGRTLLSGRTLPGIALSAGYSVQTGQAGSNGGDRMQGLFDANTHLSRLIDQIATGAETEIVVSRNGEPVRATARW
jgi:energy-coupling factor transporter ATP-binding protein EcfA2